MFSNELSGQIELLALLVRVYSDVNQTTGKRLLFGKITIFCTLKQLTLGRKDFLWHIIMDGKHAHSAFIQFHTICHLVCYLPGVSLFPI